MGPAGARHARRIRTDRPGGFQAGLSWQDPGIVRNRRKIEAAITNARATPELGAAGEDLATLVWSFRPDDPTAGRDDPATSSGESHALAKALKQRGFVFVGPVTMFALMQAIGVLEHRG